MEKLQRWLPLACIALFGCSSNAPADIAPPPGSGGMGVLPGGGGQANPGGGNGSAGMPGNPGAGTSAGGAPSSAGSGNGGVAMGGAATGGVGGGDPNADGDTPPLRPLNITAAPERHQHTVDGRPFAVDNRAPKMMGKLIIDLGVDSGGIYNFALNRGFHVYGGQIYHCNLTYENREHNGDCRLETVDGQDHDKVEANVSYEQSVAGRLAKGLADLQAQFPEEDWGYFLDADGKIRWSDIGITGFSHGAQTAARVARAYRMYRAVSRSGPRDNECGRNDQNPPYDVNCDLSHVSAWIDEESKTPTERLFAFVGLDDGQRGDDLYSMERMKYIGEPTDINTVPYPYNGSHRFIASGEGHSGFDDEKYWPALGIAWGVPQENMDYAAGL